MTHLKNNYELKHRRFSVNYLAVLSFIILGLSTILTSCSKDDEPVQQEGPASLPSITITNGHLSTNYAVVGSPTTFDKSLIAMGIPNSLPTLVPSILRLCCCR